MSSSELVIEKELETKINIADLDTVDVKVKANAKACLFFETKGKDITETKINVELGENASCDLFGFFKNTYSFGRPLKKILSYLIENGQESR